MDSKSPSPSQFAGALGTLVSLFGGGGAVRMPIGAPDGLPASAIRNTSTAATGMTSSNSNQDDWFDLSNDPEHPVDGEETTTASLGSSAQPSRDGIANKDRDVNSSNDADPEIALENDRVMDCGRRNIPQPARMQLSGSRVQVQGVGGDDHSNLGMQLSQTLALTDRGNQVSFGDAMVADTAATVRDITPESERLFCTDNEDSDDDDLKKFFPPRSPSSSNDDRYDLRPRPSRTDAISGAWVDQDETGNFDPRANHSPERIASSNPDRRKRPLTGIRDSDNREVARPRGHETIQLARMKGASKVVLIRLDSQRWSEKLQKLKLDFKQHENGRHRGDDNWPLESGDVEPNHSLITAESIWESRLRPREDRSRIEEDNGIPKLGVPAARGCLGCFEGETVCSLIDGGKYPCDACEDHEAGCKLITEPQYKDSCKNCEGRKCSFKNNREQTGDCDNCVSHGYSCCYGPASGYTRSNPCLGEQPEVFTAKRMPIIYADRSKKRKRDLKEDTGSAQNGMLRSGQMQKHAAPPTSPDDNSSSHTVERADPSETTKMLKGDSRQVAKPCHAQGASGQSLVRHLGRNPQLPKRPGYSRYTRPLRQHKHAERDINNWVSGPALIKLQTWPASDDDGLGEEQRLSPVIPLPPSPPQTPRGARFMMSGALPAPPRTIGEPTQIQTRLWHPIAINDDRNLGCSWCTELAQVVMGVPAYLVRVQETEDGYTVLNGDTLPKEVRSNATPLKMCTECTSRRLSVAACEEHQLRRMPGTVRVDFDEMCARLLGGGRRRDTGMCSICPKGAEYRCVQATGVRYESVHDQCEPAGCGLRLCSGCFEAANTNDRNIDRMINAMEQDGKDIEDLRADAFMFGHVRRRLLIDSDMADQRSFGDL